MKPGLKNVLWAALCAAMLLFYALLLPLGSIRDEAWQGYLNEAPAADDEYAFLFE